jgi:hypothetical protein
MRRASGAIDVIFTLTLRLAGGHVGERSSLGRRSTALVFTKREECGQSVLRPSVQVKALGSAGMLKL